MAAASRAALAASLTASLAPPEAAALELRSQQVAFGGRASAGPFLGQQLSARPAAGPAQLRHRTVNCTANVNDVAVGTPPIAGVDGSLKADVPDSIAPETSNGAQIQETSTFMSDVSNLIKLVDSRDIVELELKHKKYEIVIRKKEALRQESGFHQSMPGPHVMAHTTFPQFAPPQPMQAAVAPPPAVEESAPPPPPPVEAPAAPSPAAPTLPPMRSPMAGTFYRSPAPGESSFVKIGDRVQKGQVVCIVEAMKLMNEIEADQSGTIIDIVAADASPVAIDTPLFIIQP